MTDARPARPAFSWNRIARRVRVPLGFLFAAFYFWRAQPNWWSLAIGGAIAALGLFLRAMASGHVRKNEELTMTGPYAYCRNPLYLGSIIVAAGFAVAARDSWVAAGLVLLFAFIYVPVIRSEESFLRRTFADYPGYERRVPRLLPNTFRLFGFASGFSASLYRQHREYNATMGAAAMLAALVMKVLWFPRA